MNASKGFIQLLSHVQFPLSTFITESRTAPATDQYKQLKDSVVFLSGVKGMSRVGDSLQGENRVSRQVERASSFMGGL